MPLVDPDKGGFWNEQCPSRPAGLTHAHDAKCDEGHPFGMCCECEVVGGYTGRRKGPGILRGPVVADKGPDNRPMEPHEFVNSMTGRCHRCSRFELDHVVMLPAPDPLTECPVDHRSVSTSLKTIGADSEWTRCPQCKVMVEGAQAMGNVVGPNWGPGRGDLTPRQKAHLAALKGWEEYLDAHPA